MELQCSFNEKTHSGLVGEDRVDDEGGDLDSKRGFGGGYVNEDASGAESRECASGGVEEDGADVGFGLWVLWVCGFSVEMLPVLARVRLKMVRASALRVFGFGVF
ncbi:hypothetical protein ACFX15_018869 [Malus domestica]